jgi:NAD(P)-dependent dehydrogenase (short-subunit alcohol dehydrogenase family)
MASRNSVVIFGASGTVGQYVVPALLKAGVKVTVVTRTGSNTAFSYENATVATADYSSQSELVSIIRGHASVISFLSGGALSLQRNLIDAAIEGGATFFIPSEFGHDNTNKDVTSLLPIFSVKSGIITYLQEKEKDGLSWTSIITALFFDWVGHNFLSHNILTGNTQ